jgi:adenylate kinase family enzyme
VTFRVHIVGASGSGTTTLGLALASRLEIPHLDTDDYYWLPSDPPYREPRPREERIALLEPRLLATDSWVLSGSLVGWGDALIPYFDLVVFVSAPQQVRIARLREREVERYGPDAIGPGGRLHEHHREFIDWATAYDDGGLDMRSRARHEEWLARIRCQVLRLDGTRAVTENTQAIVDLRPGP